MSWSIGVDLHYLYSTNQNVCMYVCVYVFMCECVCVSVCLRVGMKCCDVDVEDGVEGMELNRYFLFSFLVVLFLLLKVLLMLNE